MLTQTENIKLWIYRSIKELTEEEEREINALCRQFIGEWASHGKKLDADFRIIDKHFLVFFVNEDAAKATGCSIDSSVALIRSIEAKYQLGLLDRMQIPFKDADGVVMHSFQDLADLYSKNIIADDSLVYNLMLQEGQNFDDQWLIPFSESPYYQAVRS